MTVRHFITEYEDPLELTATNGYLACADFLSEIHKADTIDRLLQIRREIEALVVSLDGASAYALTRANDLSK